MAAVTGNAGPFQTIETFIQGEAGLLDERRFEDWLDLFADDAYYWVPARPGQDNPLDELSLFYDTKDLLETRVRRLRHPNIHIQTPPSRTCHMISHVHMEEGDGSEAEFTVGSNFFMLEYRQDNQRLYGGRFHHRLRRDNGALLIAWKKVELINCDSVFEAMAVPF